MSYIKEYKAELILIIMVTCEIFTLLLDEWIPSGLEEVILLILLVAFILCKLDQIDQVLKKRNLTRRISS